MYHLRLGRCEVAPFREDLGCNRSRKPLAVDLSDGVWVGPERASRQNIALLHLDEVGTGAGGRDGRLDLLELVVREAAAEEDGDGCLALLGGDLRVGAQTGGRKDLVVAGEETGEFVQGSLEVQAGVDDCSYTVSLCLWGRDKGRKESEPSMSGSSFSRTDSAILASRP